MLCVRLTCTEEVLGWVGQDSAWCAHNQLLAFFGPGVADEKSSVVCLNLLPYRIEGGPEGPQMAALRLVTPGHDFDVKPHCTSAFREKWTKASSNIAMCSLCVCHRRVQRVQDVGASTEGQRATLTS